MERYTDPLIEALKKDIDRAQIRENLKLTPAERLHKLQRFVRACENLREAGRRGGGSGNSTG